MRSNESEVVEGIARLDYLLGELESRGESLAIEAIREVTTLYGEVLGRIVRRLSEYADPALILAIAEEPLTSAVLAMHGVHPHSLEERVRRALDEVQREVSAGGGAVELVRLTDGAVQVHLQKGKSGCPSSGARIEERIERVIRDHAPEVEAVEITLLPPPAKLVQLGYERTRLGVM